MTIEAVIFDFDGVVLETETPDYETWRDEFADHGVELDWSLWTGFVGGRPGAFDIYGHLEELAGHAVDRDLVGKRRRARYLSRVDSSPILPGVVDYMTGAKALGLKLGVASSSSHQWVDGHLTKRDLMRYVGVVRCRDDVTNVKPDPALFLSAAAALGVAPAQCVVIEDSANGVTAAKRAGMYCVVVPNSMTKEMAVDHADVRLGSLGDVRLSDLLERLDGLGHPGLA
jgi:HAD superfamily hydrolase (TIGR01509 family)